MHRALAARLGTQQDENGDPGTLERDEAFELNTESQCWLQTFTDNVRSSAPLISTMASENRQQYNVRVLQYYAPLPLHRTK